MHKKMLSAASKTVLITLGEIIRVARKQRGLTQTALAERLGVERRSVIAMEKGSASVSVGVFFEACYILGIPLLSHDSEHLHAWQHTLKDFDALLPRPQAKRRTFTDDF